MPISALVFLIGAMNIAGIPPTVGFISKLTIFTGAFGPGLSGSSSELILALVALLSTAMTVGYTTWAMRRIFYGPLPEDLVEVDEASPMMIIPMILLCLFSIILGIIPGPILDPIFALVKGVIG